MKNMTKTLIGSLESILFFVVLLSGFFFEGQEGAGNDITIEQCGTRLEILCSFCGMSTKRKLQKEIFEIDF